MRFLTLLLQGATELPGSDRYRAITEQFVRDQPGAKWEILGTLALIAAAPLAALLFLRLQRRLKHEPMYRPTRLLWDLSAHVPLSWPERLLLIRAARRAELENPAAVLLSANCYDRVVRQWLKASRGRGAARFQAIRTRLFAK